jgi:hypothetical protein
MDATPYGHSLLISAKACSRAAYTISRTGTALGRSDDSDNVDRIFMVPAWREEDETATEGLQPIIQSMEQSTERAIE